MKLATDQAAMSSVVPSSLRGAKHLTQAAVACLLGVAPATPAQTILQNFPGLSLSATGPLNGGSYAPPDTDGAIGNNEFVEFINGGYAVYNKTGGAPVAFTTDRQFWLNAGVSSTLVNEGVSDPRVKWDAASQRWFASEITLGGTGRLNNSVLVGVSNTANPLDGWKATSYNVSGATRFTDYDTLGVDGNAVYIGSNDFDAVNFLGVTLSSIPKSSLLAATPTTTGMATFTQTSASPTMGSTPQGVSNGGTGGTGGMILAVSTLPVKQVILTPINNTASAGATLGTSQTIGVAYDGNNTSARQPVGSRIIDTLDHRVSGTVYQVGNRIYAANAFNNGNQGGVGAAGFNSVRWLVLDATTGTVLQEGLLQDGSHDYWQPSIAANPIGDVVIGYNKSGLDMNISSFAAVGHTVGGVLTFDSDLLLATSTVNNYSDGLGTPSRWGDYSATMVDPTDPNMFWTIQEVATGTHTWGTQITAISIPEPANGGWLLAGFATAGLITRRRRSAKQAVSVAMRAGPEIGVKP